MDHVFLDCHFLTRRLVTEQKTEKLPVWGGHRDLHVGHNKINIPTSPGMETALPQREVNKVFGKEKGTGIQSIIRVLRSRKVM